MSEKVMRLCEECSKGNLKNIKKMVKGSLFTKGVPINAVSNVKISMLSGMTPLMCAAMFGRLYVAEYLISEDADVNARSLGSENTALIYAASNNNSGIVRLLLKNNADKTVKNRDGMDALQVAEKHKFTEVVSLLKGIRHSEKYTLDEAGALLNSFSPASEKTSVTEKKEEIAAPVKTVVIDIPEQQLITLRLLLGGARAWGSLNGNPSGKEYPQYNKVREIGKNTLNNIGDEGVKKIMEKIKSDGSDLYGYLDLMWDNLQHEEFSEKKL